VRAEAERMMLEDDEVDLDGVLDEAAERSSNAGASRPRSANVEYFARDVDPFFGEELDSLEPTTPEERRMLLDLGFKGLPPKLCKGDARRMFAAVAARNKKGLCSLKQAKQLARCGVDGRAMTKSEASARMTILARNDWDPNRARHELRELEIRERSTEILNKGGEA
jgi:hypothetical protein